MLSSKDVTLGAWKHPSVSQYGVKLCCCCLVFFKHCPYSLQLTVLPEGYKRCFTKKQPAIQGMNDSFGSFYIGSKKKLA